MTLSRPAPIQSPMPKAPKEYLGDSVYVSFDGMMYTFTTDDGLGPTNTIHLEPAVVNAFLDFMKRMEAYQDEEPNESPDPS